MVLGQPHSTPCKKLPSQPLSSPVRVSKDHRCSGCRLIDPPTKTSKYFLETCPHRPEFAPSPNPFTPLAEPKWDFDFRQQDSAIRRRGRRGGKRHRTAPKHNEDRSSDSIDEICRKIIALRLNDKGSVKSLDKASDIAIPSPILAAESVRHHWAPQFRPNAMLATPAPKSVVELPQLPAQASSSLAVQKRHDMLVEPRYFPMSAFIASSTKTGPQTLSTMVRPTELKNPTIKASLRPTSTAAQEAATTAALRSLALRIAKSANAPLLLTDSSPPSEASSTRAAPAMLPPIPTQSRHNNANEPHPIASPHLAIFPMDNSRVMDLNRAMNLTLITAPYTSPTPFINAPTYQPSTAAHTRPRNPAFEPNFAPIQAPVSAPQLQPQPQAHPAPLPTPPPSPDARNDETFGTDYAALDKPHWNANPPFEPRPGDGEYLLRDLQTNEDGFAVQDFCAWEFWTKEDGEEDGKEDEEEIVGTDEWLDVDVWDDEWSWEWEESSMVEVDDRGLYTDDVERTKKEEEWNGVSDWFL